MHMSQPQAITSAANASFKQFKSLQQSKGIQKEGLAIIAGKIQVAEAVANYPEFAEAWLTCNEDAPPIPHIKWFNFTPGLFKELDVAGTNQPLLVVRAAALQKWSDEDPWPRGCTLFVAFQNPDNVGAVIRSAAAFSVARVVLLEEAAHPFHPKSSRAAGSAIFQVPLLRGPSIETLTVKKAPLIVLDAKGAKLGNFPEAFGLIAGVEGPGLPAHLRAGETRSIPIAANVESLNAATATAIALYAWAQERR
jgi:tRNA G18 (ribose-2'-O)-methylase SpoU